LASAAPPAAPPEVRGTWLTTTANDAISTPEKTAATMKRLREIGINTVYVECWKNGYTQFPSQTLKKVIGRDRRPALVKQDPGDDPDKSKSEGRDLLQETLIEAHRNGLIYIAWFEYGFMAAHKSFESELRQMKPEWLSKDIKGNTVAPNGFVWMNPLHPEARRFLTDLVLEAIENYDLDGVQLDDRIVWPHITMGYDDYTREVYAKEHGGKQPPEDCHDADWTRWRADKVNEYARQFVSEVRAKRPGIVISLSPAPYPWVYDNYCLEWPKWATWSVADGGWDEFIPQNYRFSYDAYEKTWTEQLDWWRKLGEGRTVRDLIPGIRVVGEGKDSTWEDLRKSIELAREKGNGGHVLWFSRGVLDVYPKELTEFYDVKHKGMAANPHFGADWRPLPLPLSQESDYKGGAVWTLDAKYANAASADSTIIGLRDGVWKHLPLNENDRQHLAALRTGETTPFRFNVDSIPGHRPVEPGLQGIMQGGAARGPAGFDAVEIIPDRRGRMGSARKSPDR